MKLNYIYNEPNLETMARMPDSSVDAIVTDPPYGLGREPDPAAMLTAWLDHGYLEVKGRGFMGKEWDAFVPQPRFWQEAHRVLKPGGHVLSFFGTRTYDWGVMAMRLAGFEIRDQLAWCFGSGFPKSHDVSKAIDRAAGAEREVVGKYIPPQDDPKNRWSDKNSQYSDKLTAINPNVDFNGASSTPGSKYGAITAPATPEAQQWAGWGSALKPALEPIVLARKKLAEKSIAANVLAWGTGGINVDGCRVGTGDLISFGSRQIGDGIKYNPIATERMTEGKQHPSGRWPANLAHDGSPEVLALFPETSSGFMPAGTKRQNSDNPNRNTYMKMEPDLSANDTFGDSGSAARFFYCSKADSIERSYGLPPGKKNRHPTVKPLALMRWLVRLITPPGGLVYDPFAGSGTTFAACMEEGFQFIGSELDVEYAEIGNIRGQARRSLFSQE